MNEWYRSLCAVCYGVIDNLGMVQSCVHWNGLWISPLLAEVRFAISIWAQQTGTHSLYYYLFSFFLQCEPVLEQTEWTKNSLKIARFYCRRVVKGKEKGLIIGLFIFCQSKSVGCLRVKWKRCVISKPVKMAVHHRNACSKYGAYSIESNHPLCSIRIQYFSSFVWLEWHAWAHRICTQCNRNYI